MQTFILRVYRAHRTSDSVSGIVEVLGSGQMKPFQNLNDLLIILSSAIDRQQLERPGSIVQLTGVANSASVAGKRPG